MYTLDERIAERIQRADFSSWREQVTAIGGCAKPIRLAGRYELRDLASGELHYRHAGHVMVPCNNRRATVCRPCSDRYAADAFHLIRAGLIPTEDAAARTKPRSFVTLTAPSFGPVHSTRTTAAGKRIPCGCGENHHPGEPRLGQPLDPETYDYVGAVLWQAHAGLLWQRFTTRGRRIIANRAGLTVRDFRYHARLSYSKVAEYQRRGLIHFHAIIRVDGPDGYSDPAPAWATDELLREAITDAARGVDYLVPRPDGVVLMLRWGDQLDIRPIHPAAIAEIEDSTGHVSDAALSGYIAKYSTKGTGKTQGADHPIRSEVDIQHLRVSEHHRRIIATCWQLGALRMYDGLNLRRWAHMLGFRGHFLTKSRCYSTTFRAIRDNRRAYRLAEILDRLGLAPGNVTVINDWRYLTTGYASDAEYELAAAIAERIHIHRKAMYRKEVTNMKGEGG